MKVLGTVPRELCEFKDLRELDLDGGRLSGPLPDWIPRCFTALAELDFSYNNLTGTVPSSLIDLKLLKEFEVGHNE